MSECCVVIGIWLCLTDIIVWFIAIRLYSLDERDIPSKCVCI